MNTNFEPQKHDEVLNAYQYTVQFTHLLYKKVDTKMVMDHLLVRAKMQK